MAPTLNPAWEAQIGEVWNPRATDDYSLHGTRFYPLDVARKKVYLGPNPPHKINIVAVDIDHPDALLRALWEKDDLRPNVVIVNPENGHGHAVWYLADGVYSTDMASQKPLKWLAAIQEGLRSLVDGDHGYSGTLIKNPEHPRWETHAVHERRFTLQELTDLLQEFGHMPRPGWRRRRKAPPVGVGRNCALFDALRTFTYREIRRHWGDADGLSKAIHTEAGRLNSEFPEPLYNSELNAIARSVSRWIVRSDMWRNGKEAYEAELSRRQSHRAKMNKPENIRKAARAGGAARRERAADWQLQMLMEIEKAKGEQ